MQLNDWGHCTLLYKLSEQLYERSPKTAVLFVRFMMIKSGYDAMVGYDEKDIFLLLLGKRRDFHFYAISDP
jgi:hypothetical protein